MPVASDGKLFGVLGRCKNIDFRCFFHSRNGFTWPKYVGGILLKNLWKSLTWPSRPSKLSRYWSNHFLTCVGLGRVTLPETNMAPTRKPWWKGNDCLPGPPFFRCQFSFRECCKRFRWTEKLESPYKAVTTIRELKQVISTDILPTPFRFGILNCFCIRSHQNLSNLWNTHQLFGENKLFAPVVCRVYLVFLPFKTGGKPPATWHFSLPRGCDVATQPWIGRHGCIHHNSIFIH